MLDFRILMRIGNKLRDWLLVGVALSQFMAPNFSDAKDQASTGNPADLVSRAVQNEIAANQSSGAHFMFRNQRKTPHTNQTKLIIETREATAGLLVEVDGHPLTPQQRQAEEARLQKYVRNPEELNRKRKQEKEDAEHTIRIVKALPYAFLYESDGTQQGSASVGASGDELVRLKFRPNPKYEPPSRVEQVLTGMTGHLLVDTRQYRIAEIDGTLQKDVGFGWGILGHLDRGGRFLVQQADVGNHQWEITHMELAFTGKIFLFKKLNVRSSDSFSDFRVVAPDLTFEQGVALLEKEAGRNQSRVADKKRERADADNEPRSKAGTTEEAEQTVCCDP
jgi:hypothetical protein